MAGTAPASVLINASRSALSLSLCVAARPCDSARSLFDIRNILKIDAKCRTNAMECGVRFTSCILNSGGSRIAVTSVLANKFQLPADTLPRTVVVSGDGDRLTFAGSLVIG